MVMASKAENIIRLIGDAKNIDCQYVKDGDDRVTYIGNWAVTNWSYWLSQTYCYNWVIE